MKTIHVSADIAGILRNRNFYGLTGPDGKDLHPEEVELNLRALLSQGHRLIPAAGCDNFDPQTGCLGHEHPERDHAYWSEIVETRDANPCGEEGEDT